MWLFQFALAGCVAGHKKETHHPDGVSKMIVVVQCAGCGSRWQGDRPKWATVVTDGETLVARTTRLVQPVVPRVVADGATFVPDGAKHVRPPEECRSKLTDGWHPNEREAVVVLFGDVWFSEQAISKILNCGAQLAWFGRRSKGRNGKPYGEIFGFRVARGRERQKLVEVAARTMAHRAAWRTFHEIGGVFVEINDATEDFDVVEDLERWQAANPALATRCLPGLPEE